MSPFPETYEQWRHCITVECGIPLTPEFVARRLSVWLDESCEETERSPPFLIIMIYRITGWPAAIQSGFRGVIVKSDLVAIGLSVLCLVHCLVLPVAVAAVPFSHGWLGDDEAVVHWLLFGFGLVVTCWALGAGFRRHGAAVVLLVGVIGLFVMLMGATHLFDRWLEATLTVAGAVIVGSAHVLNLKLCAGCSHAG